MASNGKRILTNLSKDKSFSDIFLNLLFVKKELTTEDAEFLFSIAIVFIEEFEKENKKRFYIEFAYAIIVRTCLKLGDYRGLFDFSINFGFYPVARKIFQDKLISEVSFQDILSNIRLDEFNLDNPICKIKLDRKKPFMLGSDKHHICLKGTNINDLYSSYHK